MLVKSGFEVSDEIFERMICFDVIARRDKTLLVIKVQVNIDSFNKYSAMELKVVSNFLDGFPLVIGNHSGVGQIQDGAIYIRYGIPIMSPQTIFDYLVDDKPPLIFAAPGGFFVKIDGDILKKVRESRGISLGTLADAVGVSRRAIQMYENGMNAMVDVAVRLQNYLNEPIIKPCKPFESEYNPEELENIKSELGAKEPSDREVIEHLKVLGYEVFPTQRSPFDAITANQKILILTGIEDKSKSLKHRAKVIHNISQLTDKHSVFIVRKSDFKQNIEGTPIIALHELKTIDDFNEIIELIAERAV
ncbi:MAG: transcriptional regulator [Thermoplasmata archaeon]|nr:MAG: transcriptional regulator [Thermoplasmata archaeon]